MSNFTDEMIVMDEVNSTTSGRYIDVSEFDFGVANVIFDDATSTLKFTGATSDDAPDVTAAQSTTNRFDYLDVTDLEDGASIDGDTGIAASSATDNRLIRITLQGLKWFTAVNALYTGGSTSVRIKLFRNS